MHYLLFDSAWAGPIHKKRADCVLLVFAQPPKYEQGVRQCSRCGLIAAPRIPGDTFCIPRKVGVPVLPSLLKNQTDPWIKRFIVFALMDRLSADQASGSQVCDDVLKFMEGFLEIGRHKVYKKRDLYY